jgi:undecaprenyl-diphosphatase
MDSVVLHHIVALRQPWLDELMLFASAIGAGGFVWVIIAMIAAVFPDRRAAAFRMILAVMMTFAVCDAVLKPMFNRTRPYDADQEIRLVGAKSITSSFPSGHAAMAVAGALAGSQLFPAAAWVWWPLAILIAGSRLYIGIHWPTDVLAGSLLGLATAWFVLGGTVHPQKRPFHDTI